MKRNSEEKKPRLVFCNTSLARFNIHLGFLFSLDDFKYDGGFVSKAKDRFWRKRVSILTKIISDALKLVKDLSLPCQKKKEGNESWGMKRRRIHKITEDFFK